VGRHKNTEQRRAQIVEGLLDVMSSAGYSGASIQSIARAASLSPGLLHYHFGNKQEILLALLTTLAERLQARYAAALPDDPTPSQRIDAWIDAHLAVDAGADPRAVACWVQLGAEALRQPAVQALYSDAIRADLAPLTAALSDAGASAPERAAAGLMAAVQGAYQLSLATPGLIPAGSAASSVRTMAAAFR